MDGRVSHIETTFGFKALGDETAEINFPARPASDLSACAHPDSDRTLKSWTLELVVTLSSTWAKT